MSKTKIIEKNKNVNSKNDSTELNKRTKKLTVDPANFLWNKIKRLDKQGFDHNRIAAMLMCQKSLVKQVLK